MNSRPPEIIEVVCGIILGDEGRFLACRRPAGKHLAGKWEFPGGKVDAGESPEAALARELREELGVTVAVDRRMSCVEFDYGIRHIRLTPFLCRISEGKPLPLEHSEIRWCGAEGDWKALDWAEADRPILRELAENSGKS